MTLFAFVSLTLAIYVELWLTQKPHMVSAIATVLVASIAMLLLTSLSIEP